MKVASAIVTEMGGRTCHAAIISRELGTPAVVGSNTATEAICDGQEVTVCCSEGEVGKVFDGGARAACGVHGPLCRRSRRRRL